MFLSLVIISWYFVFQISTTNEILCNVAIEIDNKEVENYHETDTLLSRLDLYAL